MALYHDARISPTKAEMIQRLMTTPSWSHAGDVPTEVIGAYRFDDPAGRVGLETHIVRHGSSLLQVPLTYRDKPLVDAERSLIGQMDHTALGTRWVYDGLGDPTYVIMLAAVALTGQGEALGMVTYDGKWHIAPTHVRLRGGGWSQERVSVDDFELVDDAGETVVFTNDGFELTFHRHLKPGSQPPIGLTAIWDGQPDPAVLAEVVARA